MILREELTRKQDQLDKLGKQKAMCAMKGETGTVDSINSSMDMIWVIQYKSVHGQMEIIRLQLQLQAKSDYSHPNMVYLKELQSFINLLIDYEDNLGTESTPEGLTSDQLEKDITV